MVGNKARFFRDVPVKKQQVELDTLAGYCEDTWGEPIRFFPALRIHDPIAHPLPALDSKLGLAYSDLFSQINEALPYYARSRSPKLSASAGSPPGSGRHKKEIVEDLHRAVEGLKPFAEHSVKDFAAFLPRGGVCVDGCVTRASQASHRASSG